MDETLLDHDAMVVQSVQDLLCNAIQDGASDIHLETQEQHCRLRIRCDGLLHDLKNISLALGQRFIARLKILARLDVSERRIPQDGRFKLQHKGARWVDCRLSTCPTLFGEKLVIRLLDPQNAQLPLEALGLEPVQKQLFLNALVQPQGLILVTGPTGSGKTISLYTAVNELNKPHINITSVEDPVEIYIPGISQVTINPRIGLTFPLVLRTLLRQDPDILMVGEIRDLETAEIALQAAQTGHLVLSTVHTNNTTETLTRLIQMGLARYTLATALTLIMAQRLARRLCPFCKIPEVWADNKNKPPIAGYRPQGCAQCHLGFKGRIGLYEILPITTPLQNLIFTNAPLSALLAQARQEGLVTLYESGLEKVRQGMTSICEVQRVTTH